MKVKIEQKTYTHADGYKVTLGYFAQQADGAVWLEKNGTVVLAAVTSEKLTEFPGFLSLSIDYREVYSATGKIPGGYFKREGKPTDKEVLIGRIVDRCLRPLFPENFFDKVNVTITVYSIDKRSLPTELALMASSLALQISKIPFNGPAGCVEMAKLHNAWHFAPAHDVTMKTQTKVIVGGDINGINMVEGFSDGVSEGELADVIFQAHDIVKKQIAWQNEVALDYRGEKNNTVQDVFHIASWLEKAKVFLVKEKIETLFLADKVKRAEQRKVLWELFLASYNEDIISSGISSTIVEYAFNVVLKVQLMFVIGENKRRVDGRGFDEIRPIDCLIGLLPHSHGSAVFTRGRTQLLVTTTLGGADDVLKLDSVLEEPIVPLMLHYNFLPFSVGEARSLRGPGRREVGHGFLALNAIRSIIPDSGSFPYSMRLIGDVLECDGSSSMATICAGTLSLLDAGVPIKDMVAGIAMGMMMDKSDNLHFITDIAGIEDELGLMDFKIAGTEKMVTAIQMDIKHKVGLPKEVFTGIFEKARVARCFILSIMAKTIHKPKSLSPLVPQYHIVKIAKDKIGAVIGSGGKVIKEITEKSGAQITIEDDGSVKIFGTAGEGFNKAIFSVKAIAGLISSGDECDGIIKRISDFGYFVEIAPNCDGLVHISSLPKVDQQKFKSLYTEGEKVKVHVMEYDPVTNRIRLKIIK
jgi:polyribonucleotide nucleotidyltransferase